MAWFMSYLFTSTPAPNFRVKSRFRGEGPLSKIMNEIGEESAFQPLNELPEAGSIIPLIDENYP